MLRQIPFKIIHAYEEQNDQASCSCPYPHVKFFFPLLALKGLGSFLTRTPTINKNLVNEMASAIKTAPEIKLPMEEEGPDEGFEDEEVDADEAYRLFTSCILPYNKIDFDFLLDSTPNDLYDDVRYALPILGLLGGLLPGLGNPTSIVQGIGSLFSRKKKRKQRRKSKKQREAQARLIQQSENQGEDSFNESNDLDLMMDKHATFRITCEQAPSDMILNKDENFVVFDEYDIIPQQDLIFLESLPVYLPKDPGSLAKLRKIIDFVNENVRMEPVDKTALFYKRLSSILLIMFEGLKNANKR